MGQLSESISSVGQAARATRWRAASAAPAQMAGVVSAKQMDVGQAGAPLDPDEGLQVLVAAKEDQLLRLPEAAVGGDGHPDHVAQLLGHVPVVQRDRRRDAPGKEPVHQAPVEIDPFGIGRALPSGKMRVQPTENRYPFSPRSAIRSTSDSIRL